MGVEQYQTKWLARTFALFQQLQGRNAPFGQGRLHLPVVQHVLEQASIGGVVVHHQNRQSVQADRFHRSRRWVDSASPKRAVKWKVLPRSGTLSTQMRPPISCTNRARSPAPALCHRTCGLLNCRIG